MAQRLTYGQRPKPIAPRSAADQRPTADRTGPPLPAVRRLAGSLVIAMLRDATQTHRTSLTLVTSGNWEHVKPRSSIRFSTCGW